MPRKPEEYKELRNRYKPKNIKTIFLLESPPANGGYFYDKNDINHQYLFKAMMGLIGYEYQALNAEIKEEGLRKFQKCGCFLVDAIYIPVNEIPDNEADNLILQNYNFLKRDLVKFTSKNNPQIIIVKTTLYDLLNITLLNDGFNVINGDIRVPFPAYWQQNSFKLRIDEIKQNNHIASLCR